ncbi:hypothetical protein GTP41_26430 [Pseudoduganella sp. DS3]|uniref:Lipoprotein n=1 Tax=Pseudoduganella guangdongensis TaxID=2692179 RepID=A0A6N9HRR5_9BURK|nr:hypothetical protein [Pseudoduganella guangdongensis]MYN05635.1 hypothetical protein [Pseudoduganella guangdongensis]
MQTKYIWPAIALALSACSTTTGNGLRFLVGEGATPRYETAAPQLEQLAKEWARVAAPGVLVVGDVGAMNALDGAQLRALHQAYARGGNADDFAARMGGLTSIETFGMAGLVKLERPAAVRLADVGAVGFVSKAGELFGATGDLVAARSDADGLLVLEKVLCKGSAPDFKACAARYVRGHFDPAGAELDGNLQPKRGGHRIDPASYASLPQGGAQ